MKLRPLGSTGILVSEIGLGCASYWGKEIFSESRAIRIVRRASDAGVCYFDTGHSYSDGNAEPRLGKALREMGGRRHELCISSKAGTRFDSRRKLVKDFSPAWIRQSCHESLRRLGLERLPVLFLHGPRIADLSDELMGTLANLKSQGTIGAIGINTFDAPVLDHVERGGGFDVVMLDYNILRQDHEPLIGRLQAQGVGVIAGAALGNALFSNRVFRVRGVRDLWYLARALKNFREGIRRGRMFRFLERTPGATGAQAALAYVLGNSGVAAAVFGTTDEKHLVENLAASGIALPAEVLGRIRAAACP